MRKEEGGDGKGKDVKVGEEDEKVNRVIVLWHQHQYRLRQSSLHKDCCLLDDLDPKG
jgi:hypothetical protein